MRKKAEKAKKAEKSQKKSETEAETKLVILGKNITSFLSIDKNGKQTSINLSYENCEEQDKALSVMLGLTDEEPYILDIREGMNTPLGRLWCNATPVLDLTLKSTEERRTKEGHDLEKLLAHLGKSITDLKFRTIIPVALQINAVISEIPGPLDAVSLTEFLRGWSRVGAKVGIYSKGKVVWNDHTPL